MKEYKKTEEKIELTAGFGSCRKKRGFYRQLTFRSSSAGFRGIFRPAP